MAGGRVLRRRRRHGGREGAGRGRRRARAVGLLIDTSVCRDHLEPSTAVGGAPPAGLPTSCLNFDLANACLGFVNAMQLAATMIDAGQIEYAADRRRRGQPAHPGGRPSTGWPRPTPTAEDVRRQFATLTLGSGSAAMVLGPGRRAPRGPPHPRRRHPRRHPAPRPVRRRPRADAHRHQGAVRGRARARHATSGTTPHDQFGWTGDMDCYVTHQISTVHTARDGQRPRDRPREGAR